MGKRDSLLGGGGGGGGGSGKHKIIFKLNKIIQKYQSIEVIQLHETSGKIVLVSLLSPVF